VVKNYYLILGITPEAGIRQIKSAYRDRAKRFHPDNYGGDPRTFLDIQDAYSVLSDEERRRAYDRTLDRARRRSRVESGRPQGPRPEPLGSRRSQRAEPLRADSRPRGPVDMGAASLTRSFRTFTPSFDEIFDRLWSNFSGMTRPKAETIESLNVEIAISAAEAERGGNIRVLVPAHATCPTCAGYGGAGPYECWRCAGEGAITGEMPVQISFPAGVVNGYLVRMPLDRFGIRNFYLTVHFRVTG
jgi:DnaJ-class molecular chaperone